MTHKNYKSSLTTLFCLTLLTMFASGCATSQQEGIAIKNITIIDAVNNVRNNQTVIYDGDNITFVGPAGDAPQTAESIDGTGKYLIPGLWDMHVHLTYDARFTDIMPESFLRYGITSVRDTGGLLHKLLPVVEHMQSPEVLAPRVFFSGPLLDGNFVVYNGKSVPEIGTQNATVEQANNNVAALKAAGASFIKIYEMVSPEVFNALVGAAKEHDLPIAAHVPLALTASTAGPSVNTMEHLRNIELDCAENWQALHATRQQLLRNEQAMTGGALRASIHRLQRNPAVLALDEAHCAEVLSKLRNTIQVPTAGLNTITLNPMFDRDDWSDALSDMPASVRDEWQGQPSWLPTDRSTWDQTFPNYTMAMVKRLKKAGVPIGAGTDTPIAQSIPGYSLLHELEVLVSAGLTPLEAIEAATVQPASFLSLTDKMGSIDEGKQADLVILSANPLDNISNVRKIELVIAQGQQVPR